MTGGGTRSGNGDDALSTLAPDAADAPPPLAATQESGDGPTGPQDGEAVDVLARGATVGRYLVLERLGAGAMGVVYAAYDPELDRKIALKLLRPQQETAERGGRRQARMVREAKAIARVSHPNVVAIFDVGVHEGQVFMAMEHLAGGTLKSWVADKKRSWREVLAMFVELGRGLAGAHAEGLIHRDLKPDNVLLDKNGVPKVVDFGLVRLAATVPDSSGAYDGEIESPVRRAPALDAIDPGALTRTGALTGTPAYMAPEQFRAEAADARSDQFSFCVALYEALYGERPFAGNNVLAVADSVTSGRIREAPKEPQVPSWIRRILVKGLAVQPHDRHQSIDVLLALLARDPVAARRRWLLSVGAVAVVVAGFIGIQHRYSVSRREIDRRTTQQLAEGDAAYQRAVSSKRQLVDLRTAAFAAFDRGMRDDGERIWEEVRVRSASIEGELEKAEQLLEAAQRLDPDSGVLSRKRAEISYERALLAELELRRQDLRKRVEHLAETASGQLRAKWFQPGTVSLEAAPQPASAFLERYVEDATGRRRLTTVWQGSLPLRELRLEPGTYRAVLRSSAGETIYYPFEVGRGERVVKRIALPVAGTIPPGYAFVPAGAFLYGEADDSLRTSFLDAVPIHRVETPAFLVGLHEVTYGDWIEFLDALPPAEREKHVPFLSTKQPGAALPVHLHLRRTREAWVLEFRPSSAMFTATASEPITYPGRSNHSAQRWVRMPVGGVTTTDIEAFLKWLSQRLKGARFCTDMEWERAARGADDRVFPHGDTLGVDEANFDLTYGRRVASFGPDEVGSHPGAVSPFGAQDMAGNVFEIVKVTRDADQYVARGGAYYYDRRTARVTNREPFAPGTKYPTFGFRVCADPTSN